MQGTVVSIEVQEGGLVREGQPLAGGGAIGVDRARETDPARRADPGDGGVTDSGSGGRAVGIGPAGARAVGTARGRAMN